MHEAIMADIVLFHIQKLHILILSLGLSRSRTTMEISSLKNKELTIYNWKYLLNVVIFFVRF